MTRLLWILLFGVYGLSAQDYPIQPVPFTDVRITDSFWKPRLETTIGVSIPFAFEQSEKTGRIDNFAIAGGLRPGSFQSGRPYDDSDVYKIIEGASYALTLDWDPALDRYLDSLISLIAAAQEPDGYLMTWRTIDPEAPPTDWSGNERWANLESGHELYNVGHLYEAAVAHYRATGKRALLDVALRNADLIYETFGPGGRAGYPGHQEIEIGLVKLYRVSGDPRYLELAGQFVDRRGRSDYPEEGTLWETGAYWQDHRPVTDQDEAVGHAVRAGYLYAAMADIAAITGRADYLRALERIWENVVGKKYYITGGVGAAHSGEAFGANYALPNAEAYNETCAAIAQDLWNFRMFLLQGKGKYIDVLERTLYNGVLPGQSLDGTRFFYPNPLESAGEDRSPWFGTACCPSNLTRFLPSLGGYVYAHRANTLYVNLYLQSEAAFPFMGDSLLIAQRTRYPWAGQVVVELERTDSTPMELRLRLPGWARGEPVPGDLYRYGASEVERVAVWVDGLRAEAPLEDGYLVLPIRSARATVRLELPMQAKKVYANERVAADSNRVALEYGPIVYCAEWVDNGGRVSNLLIPADADFAPHYRPGLLNGVVTLEGKGRVFMPEPDGQAVRAVSPTITLIPYYAWAHRGKGEMSVWLPERISAVRIR